MNHKKTSEIKLIVTASKFDENHTVMINTGNIDIKTTVNILKKCIDKLEKGEYEHEP